MSLSSHVTAILQLEETLIILQECLQQPSLNNSPNKKHIARLKQLYSPLFDFEHSESGSYYHAALQCIKYTYIDNKDNQQLDLPPLFINSMLCLLDINTLSLDMKRNNNSITEKLLELSELWSLHQSQDMADLISVALLNMHKQITNLLNEHIT